MKFLLDTNILLRLSDSSNSAHALAVSAIEHIHRNGHHGVLIPQIVYEFWVVATRPIAVNGMSMEVDEVDHSITAWTSQFPLLRDDNCVLDDWRVLVVNHQIKGKPAHDARLVASMLRHGVTHLLTFNTPDFRRFSGITAISPDAVVAGRVTLS